MKNILVVALLFLALNSDVYGQRQGNVDLVDLVSYGSLKMGEPVVNTDQVGLYEKYEVTFTLDGKWDNPFDPDQVSVDARFRTPDGSVLTMPGFFFQDYRRNASGRLEKVGDPVWKVRFAPEQPGDYSCQIIARNGGEEVRSPELKFTSVDYKADSGFLRISRTNPLYFEFADGTPFFAVAMDMSQGDNRGTYHRFAHAGGNFNRLFLTNGKFNLEELNPPPPRPDRGLGKINLEAAHNLDETLELGEKLGIYHMLTLTNQWTFNSRWFEHTYNKENGGILESAREYFTSEEAMRYFERRLRYIIARWAYSTSVFSWDLWNEFSAAPGSTGEDGVRWHRRMAKYISSLDIFDHPIHTNDGSLNGHDDVHSMPEMEIVSTNTYTIKNIANVGETWSRYFVEKFKKPYLLTEFGMGHSMRGTGGYAGMDPERRMVHNGLWGPIMGGSAGTGMAWEGNWLNHERFYTYARAVSQIVRDIPFSKRDWAPIRVASFTYADGRTGSYGDVIVEGWPSNFSMPDRIVHQQFKIDELGRVDKQNNFSAALAGPGLEEVSWLTAPGGRKNSSVSFNVDYPRDGEFVVYVTEIRDANVTPRLRISVDGKQVFQKDLVPLDVENYVPLMYNQYFPVEISKGSHTIQVENVTGGSFITAFELKGFLPWEGPHLEVRGIQSQDYMILWLKNQKYTVLHELTGVPLERQREGILTLQDVPDGTWLAEWVNTVEASTVKTEVVKSQNGKLVLQTPAVTESVAVRLQKL